MANDNYVRYVILLSHAEKPFTEELVKAHCAHLRRLDQQGKLVLCGPFQDYKGGMVIVEVESLEEAKVIAESDPFVSSGVETYEIRTLQVSCEENNHLGMG